MRYKIYPKQNTTQHTRNLVNNMACLRARLVVNHHRNPSLHQYTLISQTKTQLLKSKLALSNSFLRHHYSTNPNISISSFNHSFTSKYTPKFIIKAHSFSTEASSSSSTMVKAIRVHEHGGPEVLKWEDVEVGEPKEGEIRVRNKAIGLNFIDVYFRKGEYKAPAMPFIPGMEAAGEVVAVGPGLTGRQVGDIVAYAGSPMGSYAEEQILSANRVVPVPSSIDPITAASVMLKGLTAHYLIRRSFQVQAGHTVLVHAAAGGVGSLLCQWANALGATVIGTVSTREKAIQAKEDGCHHVILYKDEDFVTRVNEITGGEGVEVVYDSVGKDTFQGSLDCLKLRGHLVLFGQSSGAPDPVPISALAVKSLFLTRPTLMHYTVTRDDLLEAAGELFENIAKGILKVRVNHKYPLSQAAEAHTALETRQTTGSVVLIPDACHASM